MLHESLTLFRAVSDDWGAAYSLNDLAMVAHLQGDNLPARHLSRESLVLSSKTGDRRAQAFAHHNLGIFASQAGDDDEATREHQASLELRRATNDEWGIAVSLIQLGRLARLRGASNNAEADLLAALRITIEGNVLPIALEALVELAAFPTGEGLQERAVQILSVILAHPALNQRDRKSAEELLADLAWHESDRAIPMLADRGSAAALTLKNCYAYCSVASFRVSRLRLSHLRGSGKRQVRQPSGWNRPRRNRLKTGLFCWVGSYRSNATVAYCRSLFVERKIPQERLSTEVRPSREPARRGDRLKRARKSRLPLVLRHLWARPDRRSVAASRSPSPPPARPLAAEVADDLRPLLRAHEGPGPLARQDRALADGA